MVAAFGMARRIRRVVRLRQMLRDWRNKACLSPSDVPAGHVAIYAGGRQGTRRRFIVRVTYLNHPVFVKLLSEVEEEYGFGHDGPLTIPCDESAFEDAVRMASCSLEMNMIGHGREEEFRPLLVGLVQAPVW